MSKALAIPFLVVLAMSGSAARAFELEGAWTTNPENCSKIFVKKNNRLVFTRNSDAFGSGFIIDGNQMRGASKSCRIVKRKEDGARLHVVASCTTDIAVLGTQDVSATIDNDDQLTRNYPDFPEMNTAFHRCKR
jgi:hypothetical protein